MLCMRTSQKMLVVQSRSVREITSKRDNTSCTIFGVQLRVSPPPPLNPHLPHVMANERELEQKKQFLPPTEMDLPPLWAVNKTR